MKKKWWWQAVMTYPIWVGICYIVTSALATQFGKWQSRGWDHKPQGWTLLQWMTVLGLAALPSLYLGYARYREHRLGKEDFSPDNVIPQTTEKLRAMYPDIPDKYLSKHADGFIFGKTKDGRYIRFPLEKNHITHCVLIGDPGSGKTSGPVLCTLIKNYANAKPPMTVFAMDLKPEIAKKSVALKGNKYVRVFDIKDRDSWGFDLLYRITDKSSEDEILRVLTDYAEVLMETTNEKHAFFYENAKNVFKGCMLYSIKFKKMSFIDGINRLAAADLSTYIEDILNDPELPEGSRVRFCLARYQGKGTESFQDIATTLQQKLDVFSDAEVMWHFRDNPLKITPTDMEQGISVYVVIPEELLEHYAVIIRVIVKMFLAAFVRRQEGSNPICMILDEFPRYGKLSGIANGLATLRSRGVSIWLAIQDISQLETVYSETEARTIVNLCTIKACLSTSDVKTAKMFADWAGEYTERKASYQRNSLTHIPGGNEQVSREYRNVVSVSDVMSLREKHEVMIFCEGRYLRFRALRYYEDSALRKINEQIQKINEQ